MRKYRVGPHTRFDCRVHLVWIPKHRKPVLCGPVALRVLNRYSGMERELEILAGQVAREHIHRFLACRPHQDIITMVQGLKGSTARILVQECVQRRKQFWARHLRAHGYFAITSGNLTGVMSHEYISEQKGEPVQGDRRPQIDDFPNLPPSRR